MIKERDAVIEALRHRRPEDDVKDNSMDIDKPFTTESKSHDVKDDNITKRQCAENTTTKTGNTFNEFLELRKKLRRSIFRDDEVHLFI
jgi:hypothetical protein